MTRRDMAWRVIGLALGIGGCAAGMTGGGSPLTLLYFLAAISGVVLVLNGKRVATVLKAERRGHCHTAAAIHAQRRRRADRILHD